MAWRGQVWLGTAGHGTARIDNVRHGLVKEQDNRRTQWNIQWNS